MRRKDREITDQDKIEEIIRGCHCIRLGLYDDGQVYIVPMNFGYERKEDQYTFYLHSAKEGRKIDLIRRNSSVGFEMDRNFKLVAGDIACNYSALYQSIIGHGQIAIVEDKEEKKQGLRAIMKQNTGKDDWEFPDRAVQAVCVLKITAAQVSCKEHA